MTEILAASDTGPALADSVAAAAEPQSGADLVIGRNETFYEALRAVEAPHEDIMALVRACKPYRNLGSVKRGDMFRIEQAEDGGVRSLSFDLDEESYLTFARDGDGYEVHELTYPVERRLCAVSGTIESSLYASLKECGAPLPLAAKMNDVLGWEIDFSRDLRRGDSYRILYEEVWKDGEFVRTGTVKALECTNRGKTHEAFRFDGEDGRPGYYDGEGRNLQKQLMRAPLEYSRISSSFSYRRLHPVLKRYMPHLGIDYAAPVGTPVWAAGDGTIAEIGRKKSNGRYIRIRHSNSVYETYYLHLSRFGKGISKGAKVRQGQVIGYVGATGWATGPHLDFRVKVDGNYVNPRKLKLPAAAPVSESGRDGFLAQAEIFRRTLSRLAPVASPRPVDLASTGTPDPWSPPMPLPQASLPGVR